MPHTELAPAKVNLALHVLGRRPDGYHELDSIVAFAALGDRLTFAEAEDWRLDVTGPFAEGLPRGADNLALEAALSFGRVFPAAARRYRITLDKTLPVASGIGGGSADAAAVLRALARLAGVADRGKLAILAAMLGADVPVCLLGRTCRMRGVGERIEIVEGLDPMPAVLVNPGVPLATAEVFARLDLRPGDEAFPGLSGTADPAAGRNDLTGPALALAPAIGEVIAALEAQGDLRFARLSGSGATCFGIFSSAQAAAAAARTISAAHPAWWVAPTTLG
ncbi:MAG: 4-(cytidine 5'-diphospho)-2-C-methyl-D-erythritol kinase [Parvibaculaceae bacterium]